MTYGWAILIIAIVMVALFQLGILGGTNVAPHATAGACQIYRSAAGSSLAGQCNNLEPQFVSQFSGTRSDVNLPQINSESGTNPISYTIWFNTLSIPGSWPVVFGDTTGSPRNGYDIYFGGAGSSNPNHLALERFSGGSSTVLHSISNLPLDTWYFAVVTYDGTNLRLYLNGVLQGTASSSGSITVDSIMSLGATSGSGNYGNFDLADFQIYNTSLSQSEVTALYQEGIGGAPIDPTHIVGWWPLNGNAQDYSGNNNGGVPTNVVYTSSWTSGYTAP